VRGTAAHSESKLSANLVLRARCAGSPPMLNRNPVSPNYCSLCYKNAACGLCFSSRDDVIDRRQQHQIQVRGEVVARSFCCTGNRITIVSGSVWTRRITPYWHSYSMCSLLRSLSQSSAVMAYHALCVIKFLTNRQCNGMLMVTKVTRTIGIPFFPI
jgi:hypothetical protein